MEYESVITSITVLMKGCPIYHESATTISIDDEAAGPFLVISQDTDGGHMEIRISPDEWPYIKEAIEDMLLQCEKVCK